MKVEFLAKFGKDLDKLNQPHIKKAVVGVIIEVEKAQTIQHIKHIKKLKGAKIAYRIRVGDYRIGIFYENGIVQFTRIAHRKDIYKIFP